MNHGHRLRAPGDVVLRHQHRDHPHAVARLPVEAGFFVVLATNIEIALAVLVVHTTPLVIFPVSVFLLKNREELTQRTVLGAALVLAGIALLALR